MPHFTVASQVYYALLIILADALDGCLDCHFAVPVSQIERPYMEAARVTHEYSLAILVRCS